MTLSLTNTAIIKAIPPREVAPMGECIKAALMM
jgi:hypothetical protein